jgi:hypothetical protein
MRERHHYTIRARWIGKPPSPLATPCAIAIHAIDHPSRIESEIGAAYFVCDATQNIPHCTDFGRGPTRFVSQS